MSSEQKHPLLSKISNKKRNGFFKKVYRVVSKIPPGKVTTYGVVAKHLGTKDSRKVGWALHANKTSDVPCHRVVNKDGRLAPGYVFGGPEEQKLRLISEGVVFTDENHINMQKCGIMNMQ